jgi:hypothetical protein
VPVLCIDHAEPSIAGEPVRVDGAPLHALAAHRLDGIAGQGANNCHDRLT